MRAMDLQQAIRQVKEQIDNLGAGGPHEHPIAEVEGLQAALDGKAAVDHVHEGGPGGAAWGGITGTLSDQTDLQTALDAKAAADHNHDASYAAAVHNHDAAYEAKNANIQAHVAQAHAPSDAQKNSDILKAEIEAVLTGEIATHSHAGGPGGEAFPVGSVFIAVVNTNPGTLLGYGTWAAFAAGRMLVGFNAADSDFDVVEETGGAKTVTLTAAQSGLPQHTHVQNAHTHVQDAHTHNFLPRSGTTGSVSSIVTGTLDTSSTISGSNQPHVQLATAVNQNATAVNQNAGPTDAAQAHSNMPPYITVYMWKRTA